MRSATVTELPLRLHPVEPDPFLEAAGSDRPAGGEVRPPKPVDRDELLLRSRHAELAA